MSTITLKVSESDKRFMKTMADFEGISLSELIRSKTIEALEDQYDAKIADMAYYEYQEGLTNGERTYSLSEVAEELGFDL